MPAPAPVRKIAPLKDLYGVGEIPPLGNVPGKMHAWAIRKERHGPPDQSFQLEVVPTWPIGEDEVLILVMAAGVNYNGIWAGLGQPVSPLQLERDSAKERLPRHVLGEVGCDEDGHAVPMVGARRRASRGTAASRIGGSRAYPVKRSTTLMNVL